MIYSVITNEEERGFARYKYLIEAESEDEIMDCVESGDFIERELLNSEYGRNDYEDSIEIESVKVIEE